MIKIWWNGKEGGAEISTEAITAIGSLAAGVARPLLTTKKSKSRKEPRQIQIEGD